MTNITIRGLEVGDANFIYSTFLRGVKYGSDFYKATEESIFFAEYQKVLEGILNRPVNVVIASLSDEPDVILGWAIYDTKTLYYVYTKEAWRRQGIATKLLVGSNISEVAHMTKLGEKIRTKKGWKFDPFNLKEL